ncbi:hypothetical protein P9112_004616 [Eukaryota sp. TZLM1-RC]
MPSCHGLTMGKSCETLWNSDRSASLNMLAVMEAHVKGGDRPVNLQRAKVDKGSKKRVSRRKSSSSQKLSFSTLTISVRMDPTSSESSEIRRQTLQRLESSGQRAKLMDFLRHRLTESGFKEIVKNHCKQLIDTKGLDSVTVDTLAEEVTSFARAAVPNDIKEELLQKLRDILNE